MIISGIMNLFLALIKLVFGFINLPSFPESLTSAIDTVLEYVYGATFLLSFFIRPATIKIVIPVLILLLNFDKVYNLTIFILRKIPFLRYKVILNSIFC